jgi:hypothetical protein
MTNLTTDDTDDDSRTNEEVLNEWISEVETRNRRLFAINEVLRAGLYAVLVVLNNIEKANVTQDPAIYNLVKEGRNTARETLKEAANPQ